MRDNVSLTNPTGAITGPITYFWQQEVRPGVFEDILIIEEAPEEVRATGLTFTPGDDQVGLALRVRAVYKDANDVLETVFSAPTALVANVNDAPVGTVVINDTTPTETQGIIAINDVHRCRWSGRGRVQLSVAAIIRRRKLGPRCG